MESNISANNQIYNIKSISGEQWAQVAEKITAEKTYQGHSFHFINKDGEIKTFANIEQAEKSGFKKIKFQDVVKISQQILNRNDSANTNFKIGTSLKELGVWREKKMEAKYQSALHTLNPKVILKKSEIKEAKALAKALGAYKPASPAELKNLDNAIKTAKPLTRSRGGIHGVLFLKSDASSPLVCKLVKDPDAICFSERLFTQMGFHTAHPYFIPVKDETPYSQALIGMAGDFRKGLGSKLDIFNDLEKKIADREKKIPEKDRASDPELQELNKRKADLSQEIPEVKRQYEGMRLQIKAASHVQVAGFVQGTSFAEMTPIRFQEALSDNQFLKELGKMVLLDAFLGNDDRIQPWAPKQINMGNIMGVGPERTGSGWRVALIDNQSKLQSVEACNISKAALEGIFEGKHNSSVEKYVDLLISQAIIKNGNKPVNLDRENMIKQMNEGVREAAKQVTESLSGDRQLQTLVETSGAVPDTVHLASVRANLNYIKSFVR